MDTLTLVIILAALAVVGAVFLACKSWEARERERAERLRFPTIYNALGEPWAPPPVANSNTPELSAHQLLVLHAMCDEIGYTAADIAERTGLDAKEVNAARRDLRVMGLAYFGPLFDLDGAGVRGSGYVLTTAGLDAKAQLPLPTAERRAAA